MNENVLTDSMDADATRAEKESLRPRAFETIVYGGLAVGILDFFDAITFFGLYYGSSPIRIFQSVASGLIGKEAATGGGIPTFLLGLFLHFVVAFGIATV